MSLNEAASGLGARVRELRLERGLTLKALGHRAGLSHPFLSQLERGLARPSVGSVERIASALDVPVGALWSAPRPELAEVVRSSEGTTTPHEEGAPGGVRELWAGNGGLHVTECTGGARTWPDEALTTSGQVVVFVVRGAVEVDLDGTLHELQAGDALKFDGAVRHRLRRSGPVSTRALYISG